MNDAADSTGIRKPASSSIAISRNLIGSRIQLYAVGIQQLAV
jgi:hypothetical protein